MTPTPRKFRSALLLLLPLALAQTPEEAAAHEANAQKQLADMLTDSLAMLRHGSAASVESAAEGIAALAVETTVSQPFHPITFRNAALKAGVVDELTRLLVDAHDGKASTRAMHFSLLALEAIATDDPSTDLDNGHALAVCKAGAVAPVVTLLRHDDEMVQVAAAGCAAILAECPQCQAALLQQGAAEPLVALGTYGNDAAKMRAVAALDLLALNNPAAQKRIELAGGLRLLGGIAAAVHERLGCQPPDCQPPAATGARGERLPERGRKSRTPPKEAMPEGPPARPPGGTRRCRAARRFGPRRDRRAAWEAGPGRGAVLRP